MAYNLVFLDFDGTLSNFEAAQEKTLKVIFNDYKIPCSDSMIDLYNQINIGYWKMLERGEITKPELEIARFRDFLTQSKIDGVDPVLLNESYMGSLHLNKALCEEAEPVCREISKKARIIIATNGSAQGQMKAINNSAIAPYVEAVAVSESAGYPKPDPRFFQYAMELASTTDKKGIIMVGDSLSADIAGGIAFGIDTCWFNPGKDICPAEVKPSYIINSLTELIGII